MAPKPHINKQWFIYRQLRQALEIFHDYRFVQIICKTGKIDMNVWKA